MKNVRRVIKLPENLDAIIAAEAGPGRDGYSSALVALLEELLPPAEECELTRMRTVAGVH